MYSCYLTHLLAPTFSNHFIQIRASSLKIKKKKNQKQKCHYHLRINSPAFTSASSVFIWCHNTIQYLWLNRRRSFQCEVLSSTTSTTVRSGNVGESPLVLPTKINFLKYRNIINLNTRMNGSRCHASASQINIPNSQAKYVSAKQNAWERFLFILCSPNHIALPPLARHRKSHDGSVTVLQPAAQVPADSSPFHRAGSQFLRYFCYDRMVNIRALRAVYNFPIWLIVCRLFSVFHSV